ncbi:MAG TPA: hypothetical protein DCQ06_01580 [Myxococcales bacterium]|nr:hypothetical protein [Myxococcales bacterium]HAN30264.1 hypothetical protein [Myxococcales bacterium]
MSKIRLIPATEVLLRGVEGPDRASWRARLLRSGNRGVLFDSHDRALAHAQTLRALGLLVAIRRSTSVPNFDAVMPLLQQGPVLVVVDAEVSDSRVQAWLQAAIAIRHPMLRLTFTAQSYCPRHGWPGDVELEEIAGQQAKTLRLGQCVRAPSCPPEAVSNQYDLLVEKRWSLPVGSSQDRITAIAKILDDEQSTGETADLAERQPLYAEIGDELWRCDSDNQGWGPEDRRSVQSDLGQVYFDRSDKARLDDFEQDLGAMQMSFIAGASHQVWRLSDNNPFVSAEQTLFDALEEVQGLVVDIGAGPIRYLGLLRDRIASGQLRYMAVEPDLAALKRTAAQLPGAMLAQGIGEHLPVLTKSANWVLMLRSYNHLIDVPRAIAEASRVCKPGGQLIIVDNVAFGLVRTGEQLERARAISTDITPFEHFRNANADEAVAALEADGHWLIDQVDAVAPHRANQWFVRATRLTDDTSVS